MGADYGLRRTGGSRPRCRGSPRLEHFTRWAKTRRVAQASAQNKFAAGAAKEAVRRTGLDERAVDPRDSACTRLRRDVPRPGVLAGAMAPSQRDRRFRLSGVLSAGDRLDGSGVRGNCEPHMPAQCLAALFDAQGPNLNCIAACASSTQAIGEAAEMIRRGEADVMLAGGIAQHDPSVGIAGLHRLSVLTRQREEGKAMRRSTRTATDSSSARGRDRRARRLEHARRAGRRIWGEVDGYASAHEAYHLTDTHPEGGALIAMRAAGPASVAG